MQESSVLLSLTAVFVLALISPGPDVALVVRTSIHQGRRSGLLSALGLACGILLHGILVLTGVSLLLSSSPILFNLIQVAGAGFLAWLGVGALRSRFSPSAVQTGQFTRALEPSALGPWLRGFATNILNPKALVFFLALLSSLIPAHMSVSGKVAAATILFGVGLLWFSLLSIGLTHRSLQVRLMRLVPTIDLFCGVVFIFVAAAILVRVAVATGVWQ
ncbi:LysE family translocator [Pseudomonas sp. M30-35]|uniref:LysE family translocator n=1 Tax=Pseudomonas sp. M30-35 TaxID=1981174 RepID=UPI000B3CD102|nr:LysE family translocator [Pseudomonas sp. M30-35]ARU88742.1 lysine transporter LysE [Pseudomonas sp. M30-35]